MEAEAEAVEEALELTASTSKRSRNFSKSMKSMVIKHLISVQ